MSKRRRRKRRAEGRENKRIISIPPSDGMRRRNTIPTDYSHVINDLKTIAILATVIIGGLILLSYFI